MKSTLCMLAAALTLASPVLAGDTPSPPEAMVYFGNLEDGATVQGPVKVMYGLAGMGVAPAGTEAENTGHHHLLINRAPFGEGEEDGDMSDTGIDVDDNHVHCGKGQTETTLNLPAGTHTLHLVLGDLYHVPHNPR